MDSDTTDVTLDTTSGPARAYVAAPHDGGPGVLVLHAWWGLNDDFRKWCDDLAAAGFTALAPDLRDGRVVDTIDEADAMRKEFGSDRLGPAVNAAKDELLARTGAGAIGVVGASMGASWAFDLAESDPERIEAVVAYYGIAEADWRKVRARVLHHFGDRDQMDPVEDAQAMQEEMESGGIDATLELYPGADHWFAEPSRPEYDPDAAALAWRRTVAFLHSGSG
jgi:carboxymethylenebutenolidase